MAVRRTVILLQHCKTTLNSLSLYARAL